jgi:hypothetical protein
MAFDAGTIMARLDLDESTYDRKMKAAQARADQFEKDPINLKIGDVFDQQQLAKARRMFTQLDQQITRDAVSRSRSGSGSVLGTLMSVTSPGVAGAPSAQQAAKQGLLGRITGMAGGAGGGIIGRITGGDRSAGGAASGLLGGIGPGILGLGTKTAGILGLGGAALGALPALAGIGGVGAIAGVGAGILGLGAQQLIGKKNVAGKPPTQGPLFDQAQQASAALKDMLKSAAGPLIAPLKQAFSQIPTLLRAVGPALKQAFAGAGTLILPILHGLRDLAVMVLPLLGKAFRAAAPLIQPLIDGLGALLRGILPGLTTLLRASAPAIAVFSHVLAILGNGIGMMLRDFAPAIRASSVILGALGKVLAGIFPIVGKLASVFARALAPIFVQLAGVIRTLLPILEIVGKVFASLAGAILGDLVAAFGALAKLLVDISPALRIVATTLSSVFKVLENSGVFAILGNALEAIVPILGKLINTLVRQLAPVLPVLITLISQFATIMITLLAAGLTTILTGILLLIKHFPFLVPLLGAATAAFLLFNLAMDANPIGLVILAIGALVGAGTLLVKHWRQIWGDIKNWAADAWNFIWNGFGKFLLPLLGPVGLIAFGVIELARHWRSVWGGIKQVAADFVQWIWNDFALRIIHFVTVDIPGGLRILRDSAHIIWDEMEIAALRFVNAVIGIFAKLPGPLGAPFRAAHTAIQGELNRLLGNVRQNEADIQRTWDRLHGKTVKVRFQSIFGNNPVNNPLGTLPGHAGGTPGAAPGWGWVGERGPELVRFHGGEPVLSNPQSMAAARGYANGTGWNWMDVFSPPAGQVSRQLNSMFASSEGSYIKQVEKSKSFRSFMRTLMGTGLGGMGDSGVHSGSAARAQAYARSILGQYGWSTAQMAYLVPLWNQESGWNSYAVNASSGAYGIPQSLGHGHPYNLGDYINQIIWGLNYIRGRYGSPAGAWQHEQAFNWYDGGGWLQSGMVRKQTRRPEAVLNPGQSAAFLALAQAATQGRAGLGDTSGIEMRLERVIRAIETQAARTGGAMADALNGAARTAAYRSAYSARG